ncbi:hypothetical protein [Actinomyces trachealis]|uniref:hypothetical protein n=1 Tax=Actinomyces trachealis TaxID=2763540 RepID=UPI001892A538|nr:hypothetical protein [Actinomyces trachealis]
MEGYWLLYTGVFNYDDGSSRLVEGYRFARVVKDAGLRLSVQVMCDQGADEWMTILRGIRLEGATAGKMH